MQQQPAAAAQPAPSSIFTMEQLDVLRNQILAFRLVKVLPAWKAPTRAILSQKPVSGPMLRSCTCGWSMKSVQDAAS
jgi:hypothetical protein